MLCQFTALHQVLHSRNYPLTRNFSHLSLGR
jgi:hypothetical protein